MGFADRQPAFMQGRPPIDTIGWRGLPLIEFQINFPMETTTQNPNKMAVTTTTKMNVSTVIMLAPIPV